MSTKLVLGFLGVFLLGVVVTLSAFTPSETVNSNDIGVQSLYTSKVCAGVTRADGSYEDHGCSDNPLTPQGEREMINSLNKYVFTNAGAEAVEQILGQGTNYSAFDFIGLCNASTVGTGCTAPDATDTTIDNEFTDSGLARSQGTYYDIANGNWTIGNTFTATADNLETNVTGLYNFSTGGTLLATNNFTKATLQTNDQLTINISIEAS